MSACPLPMIQYACAWSWVYRETQPRRKLRLVFEVTNGVASPFVPLGSYFLEFQDYRRPSAQVEMARAVQLLLEFSAAQDRAGITTPRPHLLRDFVKALLSGTVDDAGADPLSLGWSPRTRRVVRRMLHLVTRFTDWLANRTGEAPLNALRPATPTEKLSKRWRNDIVAARSLLGDARSRQHENRSVGWARSVQAEASALGEPTEVYAFDRSQFPALLLRGFGLGRRRRPKGATRNALIAILLHAGGLRVSEPFHLWCDDVTVDPDNPKSALVRLFHPTEGEAPVVEDGRRTNREACLAQNWKLTPRNQDTRRGYKSGWKNLSFSDQRRGFAQVHWFPTFWGEVFLALFHEYLRERPKTTTHPYLFVSERSLQEGKPYTVHAYEQAHACAVRKIGLTLGKCFGTTPHSHRHAYAEALIAAGCNELTIQRCLHHRSIHSQEAYNAAKRRDRVLLADSLRKASLALNEALLAEMGGLLK